MIFHAMNAEKAEKMLAALGTKPVFDRGFLRAVERVGSLYREGKRWFSTAAVTLHDDTVLPPGMAERALVRRFGSRLTVRISSREDMVCLKMWAAINRGEPDIGDLAEMKVSEEEARRGAAWCLEQDAERLPEVKSLLEELGHGRVAEEPS